MPLWVLKKYTKSFEIKVKYSSFLLKPLPLQFGSLSFLEVSLSFTFPLKHFFHWRSQVFCVCCHARGCWWQVARISRLSQIILRSADMLITLCLRQMSKEIKLFSGLNSRKYQKIQSDLWNYREGSKQQAEWIFCSNCVLLQCSSPFRFIKSPANWHPLPQNSVGLIWHFVSLLKMTETGRGMCISPWAEATGSTFFIVLLCKPVSDPNVPESGPNFSINRICHWKQDCLFLKA